LKRIDAIYEKLKEYEKGATAIEIAEDLDLSRANVSSDLNKLCEEGRVSKSSGRPVIFSILKEQSAERFSFTIDKFSKLNESLFTAVEQAKAAVLYPPRGMNILILGDTGVGKSMFASLIHKYAVESK